MTPSAGVRINLAMEDGLVLGRSLIKRRGDNAMLWEGSQELENNMLKRAEAGALLTCQNLVGTYGKPEDHDFRFLSSRTCGREKECRLISE